MGEAPDKEQLGGSRTQTARRRGRQRGGGRGRRARPAAPLPLVPAAERLGAAADRELRATRPTGARRSLLSIVPRDRRKPYKVRQILDAVFDRGSVFELGARYGRSLVTALARLDGRPVGVLASDPAYFGGGLTAEASDKMTRFVDLCDQFRLPVVNFVDQPGFVIGTAAERAGTIRRGTRALYAGYQATRAVGVDPRAQGLRRRRRGARQPRAPEPALRVAVRRLGLAAGRGRHRGRLPARARGRRRPRRRSARRSRSGSTRSARRSARRSASASRRSSTRATRGRCCATGPSARMSWSLTRRAAGRRHAAYGPDRRFGGNPDRAPRDGTRPSWLPAGSSEGRRPART